jgi:hypothetical protein
MKHFPWVSMIDDHHNRETGLQPITGHVGPLTTCDMTVALGPVPSPIIPWMHHANPLWRDATCHTGEKLGFSCQVIEREFSPRSRDLIAPSVLRGRRYQVLQEIAKGLSEVSQVDQE